MHARRRSVAPAAVALAVLGLATTAAAEEAPTADPRVAALTAACAEILPRVGNAEIPPAPTAEDPVTVLDELWARRGTRQGLVETLASLEKAAVLHPDHADVLVLLARGYYVLGDGYTDGPDEKLDLFQKGMDWGKQAMKASQGKRAWDEKVKDGEAVAGVDATDIASAYWYATNLGKWARAKGFGTVVAKKNEIARILTWVRAADEKFFHGAPPRYWGSFYAVAPSFAGGSLPKSKENFERAIEIAPTMLSTYVLFADTYATKAQDKELFLKNLETVIKADPAALPDLLPEQLLEQKKACAFVARTGELFGE